MCYRFEPVIAAQLPGPTPAGLGPPEEARRRLRQGLKIPTIADLAGVATSDLAVPAALPGQPDVRIRIYEPSDRQLVVPAIIHVHGGGFVMGGLDNSQSRCAHLASALGSLVLSVDYRLAPEDRYPAALEDVLSVLRWVWESAPRLQVDPDRIALHGISSGAGLVAAAALYARDHGLPRICFQHLSIPMLDDRLETPSARRFTDTPNWTAALTAEAWDAYLGGQGRGTDAVSQYAAPARARNLSGLPPTYIGVMEFDPLRDEGIAYAQALLEAGVQVELHLFPGTFHGSSRIVDSPVTQRELQEEVSVLKAALASTSTPSAAGKGAR